MSLTNPNASVLSTTLLGFATGTDTPVTSSDTVLTGIEKLQGQLVQKVKVPITAAQFKALNSTPLEIIATPGSGKAIDILDAFIEYTFSTGAYTVANDVILDYGATKNIRTFNKGCFTGGASGTIFGTAPAPTSIYTTINNVAVTLRSASDPTGGSGTFAIYLTYRVVTL